MFEKFSDSARRVLFYARYEASQTGSPHIGTEHLLLGLLKETEDVVREIFARCKVSIPELQAEVEAQLQRLDKVTTSEEIPLHESCKKALHFALDEAKKLLHGHVGAEHLLLGLLRHKDSTAGAILHDHGMQLYEVREHVVAILQKKSTGRKKKEKPLLEEFSRNLNQMAAEGQFDPLIGRDGELQRIMQVLSRRRKNNPVLLGEPGVGKTAIVEGLAQRINEGDVPPSLAQKTLLALDLSLIVAGTKYRGQFEERLKGILKELADNPDMIVFIDEIHNLIGAGSAEGSLDAASILKPALSRGEIQCIGATTYREYHRYIEKDRALVRRFQPIRVASPDETETLRIVKGVQDRYEKYHRVRYTNDALTAAVAQSNRYITDRALPDKAIDVLDEAGARVKLRRAAAFKELRKAEKQIAGFNERIQDALARSDFEMAMFYREEENELIEGLENLREQAEEDPDGFAAVSQEDVEEVISTWTSVPIQSLKMDETEKLLKIESALHERVVGQEQAISAISRAIRRSRSGLKDPRRPIGSFMFLGPTGVGKTEVAKAVAEYLFNDESALIRFDMSEYMEVHAVAKMIGSPPGYVGHEEGGSLTKKLREQPYSVLLLDEVEKAHPDILNILLQILEDGHVTDSHGERVDCKNTIIVMTSNIGSRALDKYRSLGFQDSKESANAPKERRDVVMREVKRLLSPEFINRIDEIVLFEPLRDEDLQEISRLLVARLNRQLASRNVVIDADSSVHEWLVRTACTDRSYGARPLRRALQRHVEDPLSESIIRAGGVGEEGVRAIVSVEGEELKFSVERRNAKETEVAVS